jgi:hypothetical protein
VVTAFVLPNVQTQEPYGSAQHVVGGTAGRVIAAIVPFHALGAQWPWTGEDVTNLITVVLPALLWSAIALALLRRKLTIEPWFVLANVASLRDLSAQPRSPSTTARSGGPRSASSSRRC